MIHFSLNLFKVLKNLSHWICRLGSTKAEYTSPKNSLFYADPFSKSVFGLKLRVIFFLISQKIFNCYSSWSISFIYIYIYFYIFTSYLYLFRQYICELIKTNNTLLKLTSQGYSGLLEAVRARARAIKHGFFIIWYRSWDLKMKHAASIWKKISVY